MKLGKVKLHDGSVRVALVEVDEVRLLDLSQIEKCLCLADILHSPDPAGLATFLIDPNVAPLDLSTVELLAPIDRQEVWAAGVTYKRSQVARMEESEAGASHYDKVYTAPRPELFFKGMANRVSGPGEPVRVRYDSGWSVPEPEFTLVLNPQMQIVGYTIGNDMSARDIEGENPLYLPQAKVYRQCCGLGPVIALGERTTRPGRDDHFAEDLAPECDRFNGETNLGQLNRKLPDLADWLGRENDFPNGAFLLTGTGIVPPDEFTLEDGDRVAIEVTGVGTLENPVVKDAAV